MKKGKICSIWGICLLAAGTLMGGEYKEVRNGMIPSGKQTLSYKEDLRIGPESGDDKHLWTGVDVAVEVNDKGHIFIVDPRGNRILEFDKEGKFVRQIGEKGEGPGEYSALKQLTILADQSAIVLDQTGSVSSWTYLDSDMKFVRKQGLGTTGKLIRSSLFAPDGKHIAALYFKMDANSSATGVDVGVLNQELDSELNLRHLDVVPFDLAKTESQEWWSDFIAAWLGLMVKPGLIAFGKDGSIFTTREGKYEITQYNAKMEKQKRITRQYKPIPLSEKSIDAYLDPFREEVLATLPQELAAKVNDKVIAKALEKAGVLPRKNPIFGMIPLDDGTLLVVSDHHPETGKAMGDLFSPKGKYVGRTALPPVSANVFGGFFGYPVKMKAKGNHLYVLEQNEDGEFTFVRYRYQHMGR